MLTISKINILCPRPNVSRIIYVLKVTFMHKCLQDSTVCLGFFNSAFTPISSNLFMAFSQ